MPALLALFKRALREHSRSGALILARAGLAVTLITCLILFGSTRIMISAAGLEFFKSVIIVNALFITAGGCSYFASAIAEEKEDGTLPLLRMTDLSPLALLFGKGGSRMLDGLLLLAVQIPFTLVGVTLGGITWQQVTAAYVALGSYLFLLCNCGLLAGVLMDRPAKAAVLSGAMVWLVLYGGEIAQGVFGTGSFQDWRSLDVFAQLGVVVKTGFGGPIVARQAQASLVLGGLAFVASWLLFDRFSSGMAARSDGLAVRAGKSRLETTGRAPLFGLIGWKDYHFLHGGATMVAWKLAGYGLALLWLGMDFILGKGAVKGSDELSLWGVKVVLAGLVALCAEVVIATSRVFSIEHRDCTLSTLITLPHQNAEMLLAAKITAIRQVLKPALSFTIFGLVLIVVGAIGPGRQGGDAIAFIALVISPVGLAFLFPIIWAQGLLIQRLVLYFSLRLRTGAIALGVAVWVMGNILVGVMCVMVLGIYSYLALIVGTVVATLPAGIAAAKLRQKNIQLIEQCAQME
jgi:hypothetical protein